MINVIYESQLIKTQIICFIFSSFFLIFFLSFFFPFFFFPFPFLFLLSRAFFFLIHSILILSLPMTTAGGRAAHRARLATAVCTAFTDRPSALAVEPFTDRPSSLTVVSGSGGGADGGDIPRLGAK
jgi:hypothetical protein